MTIILDDVAKVGQPLSINTVDFLKAFHPNGLVTFQTFDDNKDRSNPGLVKVLNGSFDSLYDQLLELNKQGASINFTVNQTDLKGRKRENMLAITALFVDFDGVVPDPEKVKRLPEPSIIVRSRNGEHWYWLLNKPETDLKLFQPAQKKLIGFLDSDKQVNSIDRVMRLPGFNHQKVEAKKGYTGEPFLVEILKFQGNLRYTIEEVVGSIPDPVKVSRTAKSVNKASKAGEDVDSYPKVLKPYVAEILAAVEGTRNATLNKQAFLAGKEIAKKRVTYSEAESYLLEAAKQIGLPENEATITIASGLKAGLDDAATQKPTSYQKGIELIQRVLGEENIRYNIRKCEVEVKGYEGKTLEDIWYDLVDQHSYEQSLDTFVSLLKPMAKKNEEYDPVKEYLDSLEPQNPNLIYTIASHALGADEEIHKAMVVRFMIAAVARVYQPGCKVDTALILNGRQGRKKSAFLEALAGEFFVEPGEDEKGKDELMVIAKGWIIEYGELEHAWGNKGNAALKGFITRKVDTYRAPYARKPEAIPRRFVLAGTTNRDDFLTDPTGARRFWVVPVSKKIDTDWVKANRDQLWAEAKYLYEAGEQWWLTDLEEAAHENSVQDFTSTDPWDEIFAKGLACLTKDPWGDADICMGLTISEMLQWFIGIQADRIGRKEQMRAADILKRLGWKKTRITRDGGVQANVWIPNGQVASPYTPTMSKLEGLGRTLGTFHRA